jgi:hypothetical protein
MAEPLSTETDETCEALAARIAADLSPVLDMSFQEARAHYVAVLRHHISMRTRPDQDAPKPLMPHERAQIRAGRHHRADVPALLDEIDRLEDELHTALARPWEVWGPRLFNDLVDAIKREDWTADDKASAILTILTLKGVVAIDQSRDLRRAVERVCQLERGVTDVWAALKAAPSLVIVEPSSARVGMFVVEFYDDGELVQQEEADGRGLRHLLTDLRQCELPRWDVRLGWEIRGEPTPAGYPAEREVPV